MQTKNTKFYLLQLTIFTKDRGGFTVFIKNNIQRYDTFTENAHYDVISYEVETRSWSLNIPTLCRICTVFQVYNLFHVIHFFSNSNVVTFTRLKNVLACILCLSSKCRVNLFLSHCIHSQDKSCLWGQTSPQETPYWRCIALTSSVSANKSRKSFYIYN